MKTFFSFFLQILGGRGRGKFFPGHAPGIYCNNNSNIQCPKISIDYKYIYWPGLINSLILDFNFQALEYGRIKSHKYCGAVL